MTAITLASIDVDAVTRAMDDALDLISLLRVENNRQREALTILADKTNPDPAICGLDEDRPDPYAMADFAALILTGASATQARINLGRQQHLARLQRADRALDDMRAGLVPPPAIAAQGRVNAAHEHLDAAANGVANVPMAGPTLAQSPGPAYHPGRAPHPLDAAVEAVKRVAALHDANAKPAQTGHNQ